MDLVDGIRVFVTTVETGSFAAAAARLGISPKLASKYMAELEDRFGARLLQRTTRRIGLTAAGERLLRRAPDWLETLEDMRGDLRESGARLSGTLRVSAPLSFGEMHAAPMLRRFQARHPDLTVDLRLSDQFADLAAEGIDLALRIGQLQDSALIARKLGEIVLLLVAAPAYLDRAGRPLQAQDLTAHDCIRDTNLRSSGGWPLVEAGEPRRIPVSGRFLVNSARATRDLALEGAGIALCPDYMIGPDLAAGRLERVLPETEGARLDVHALHLDQRRMARRTRALLDFVVHDRFDGLL